MLDRGRRPQQREMYGLNDRDHRIVRQALPDGAATGGEGRALRAALHAQPVMGQPHRHLEKAIARMPRKRTSRSPRCSRI